MTLLQLVSSRAASSPSSSSDWTYALETADHFNALLSDFGPDPEQESTGEEDFSSSSSVVVVRTLIHGRRNRGAHLHENFSPSAALIAARPITSSRILQILSSRRSALAAAEMTRSLVVGIDRRQLEIASEEVSWLAMPDDKGAGRGGGGGGGGPDGDEDAPMVLQVGAKNKDGNGNKRKNRSPSVSVPPGLPNGESPTSDYHSQNGMVGTNGAGVAGAGVGAGAGANTVVVGSVATHFSMVEEFVAAEDAHLNSVLDLVARWKLYYKMPYRLSKHFFLCSFS